MRRISILFLLTIVVSLGVRGQEDSLRVVTTPVLSPLIMDYLRDTVLLNMPGDNQFDEASPLETNKMTYSFLPPKKEKNFFNTTYSKFIIPSAMISYGLLAQWSDGLQELDKSTHHEITEHYNNDFPIDDYMQYSSYAAYYMLDLCGVKAKHSFRDRTIVLAASYAIMGITVQSMKKGFGVERPDGSSKTSFPSGHTATAFLGAHLLFREYKDVSPWIGIAGYASATTVGALRVRNKKHWVSDVVAGAGVGILSAEVGYLLLPVFQKVLGLKNQDKSLVIIPTVTTEGGGVGLAYTF